MALPELLIDKRIVRRAIATGKLEPRAYQEILEALPDLADQVAGPEDAEPPHKNASDMAEE